MIRFNREGRFNVPFCRKPNRFSPAYITKIVNQVDEIKRIMRDKNWEFRSSDWRSSLQNLDESDFVYLDPPYVGRHTDYYSKWTDGEAVELAEAAWALPCGFALSMWKENRYRVNDHILEHWSEAVLRTEAHFYHVGPTEDLRNPVVEALLIKQGHTAQQSISSRQTQKEAEQLVMPLF
jgi:DNA adenine methylase